MPETQIDSADYGNLSGTQQSYSYKDAKTQDTFEVPAVSTDAAKAEQKETTWSNLNWEKYLGYYKDIPELKIAVDAIATWTIGKGYKTNEITQLKLMDIFGFGKDSFNTILENLVRTYQIGGDAFAEIIRDGSGQLLNLKPLDPGTIRIVANKQGLIIRYEQVMGDKVTKFQPEEMFHLARNRIADEIHGESMIRAIEHIILMRNEAMLDMKTVMHRHVYPVKIFHLDTDDTAEIASFKAKAESASDKGENLYIPKGAVEVDMASVAPNATLNPLPWIDSLNSYFFQACGVPDIIIGMSRNLTEASSKIAYLAFQQRIEEEQLYIEEAVLSQLNLEIELEFPARLENELLSAGSAEEKQELTAGKAIEPNDLTAEIEGRQ